MERLPSHPKDGYVIAITNQKGGVAKTTSTANLGIGLTQQGKRVLFVDAEHIDLMVSVMKEEGNFKRGESTVLIIGE